MHRINGGGLVSQRCTLSTDFHRERKVREFGESGQYNECQQNIMQMLECLASGYMFLIGFTVYQSFESQAIDETGVVTMPQWGECVLGGYSVEIVGYDIATRMFIFKNSWELIGEIRAMGICLSRTYKTLTCPVISGR